MKKIFYFPAISIILFYFIASCSSVKPGQKSYDYYPGNIWRTSTPEAQGMDSGRLVKMLNYIQSTNLDIHSIIIIRHGYVVLEAYAAPFGRDVPHVIYSCTKSITSALIGIAIKEGYIKNTDQKVLDLLPEIKAKNKDKSKEEISIDNLLTMTSGLDWTEYYVSYFGTNNLNQMENSKNWVEYVIDRPLKEKPGKVINYNSGDSHLLSAILCKTTGMKTSEFAEKHLFKPIGINNYIWQTDPQGINNGGTGMALTSMEMAKFGYLFLKKGIWNGNRLIPAGWVEASMSNRIDTRRSRYPSLGYSYKGYGYGYQWWELPFGGFSAKGAFGQYIMVMPERDMVVVFTSEDGDSPEVLTEAFINSSIISNGSVPENPDKQVELSAAIGNFNNPVNGKEFFFPENAWEISGKRFIGTNASGNLTAVILSFSGTNECILETDSQGKNSKISVGLDGKYRDFSRGKWTSINTFTIEFYWPWISSSKGIFTLQFDKKILKMQLEWATPGLKQEFTGKMEE